MENLALLRAGKADVALVQGGLASAEDRKDIDSLAGLFHEPFWVFVRSDFGAASFGDLKTARIAIGPEGSGTRALAVEMQGFWGEGWQQGDPRSGTAAADALMAGEIDAAVFSASITASYIETLLKDERVRLLPFPRAPAIARRLAALQEVVLLQGIVDIGANVPASDVMMLGAVAQLGVRDDLHPAIQSLLLEAAGEVHGGASAFAPSGVFPNKDLIDLPLSDEAERYYRNGPTFLRRYFSFRLANFLERAWVLVIPLLTLLIPLVRVAPPLYRWRVRRKIYIWYKDLRDLERKAREAETTAEHQAVVNEISELQKEAGALDVPLSYTEELYHLRSHIAFVKTLAFDFRPVEPPHEHP